MTPEQMCHAMLDDVFKNGTSVMKITRVDINTEFDQIGEAMNEVAHRFAHRLALDLECVLAKYDGPWYDQAWETLSQYRSEMNKLHEQVSPTFMGEPVAQKWFCLSCKSSTPGHHGTLDDRTTPCPEGLRAKNKENK